MKRKRHKMSLTKTMALIILLILLTSCDKVNSIYNDLKNFKIQNPIVYNYTNNSNQTNQTINLTQETTPVTFVYDNSSTNIFITSTNSILVIDKDKNYLIDSGRDNINLLSLLESFNIKKLESIFITIDKEEHNGGIPLIVVKAQPKNIYDNGVDNDNSQIYHYNLDKYNQYHNQENATYITFLYELDENGFHFYVPYSEGLTGNKDDTSIVVKYKNLLYMSDCYGSCENKIPILETKYLILANNGKCPTNSFDFIIMAGAEYVIGDEICSDIKEKLDLMGIKQIVFKSTMEISDKDEFIY